MGTFPNKETQFKPGQSGNPAGKPLGAKHLSTWIQDLLHDESFGVEVFEAAGKTYKGAPIKAIIEVATIQAAKGNNKWADWLAKYGYGSKMQISNDPDNPLPGTTVADETIKAFTEFVKAQSKK